jgi:hypothetical protein
MIAALVHPDFRISTARMIDQTISMSDKQKRSGWCDFHGG